ncbi:thiamine phosphate synthase [Mumia zhuanghuii]|uniref:Thiamine-phosphate synthase n=2 Tax=Mumia TaxID=1546255 RepID=A0ABW1QRP8_9ACTN|nr:MULTISPECIES: thiamine phosphate synthase [Mumia]KAA1420408.1 thiamine phosphate synthase [Mumia zhuanghuii]
MTAGPGVGADAAGRPDLRLYLVTGDVPAGADLADVVSAAVEGGVTTLQLRDKSGTRDDVIRVGTRLVERLAGTGVTFIVNDDVDAARAIPGAGLHVGPDDLHPADARSSLGDAAVIGWSIHDVAQLDDAAALEACDYLAVSPVWPTPTKPDTTTPWGLDGVRRLRDAVPARLPLVAIGGITAANAASVVGAGADGVCVVSAICSAADPQAAAHTLRAQVDAALGRAPGWSP